jgi:hypothetical protein
MKNFIIILLVATVATITNVNATTKISAASNHLSEKIISKTLKRKLQFVGYVTSGGNTYAVYYNTGDGTVTHVLVNS